MNLWKNLPVYSVGSEGGGDPKPPAPEPKAGDPPAPEPKAGDPPKPAPTALDNAGGDPKAKSAPPDWPEDWRDKIAGGDKELRKELDRFKAPTDLGKTVFEQKKLIKSGKAGDDVPMPDATKEPDKAKAWREERGLPLEATGYVIPEKVQKLLTDADKPVLEGFTKFAYENGMQPKEVSKAVEWYVSSQEHAAGVQALADKEAAESTEDALRGEWGSEYKSLSAAAAKMGKEIAGAGGADFFQARLPDGRRLGDIPEMVKQLAEIATLRYGDTTFVGGESVKAAETRMAELKAKMTANGGEWDNPAERVEYSKLLEADEKRKKVAA